MERRKELSRLELKVGIAAGIALVLLAVIIFSVGKIRLGQRGYPLDISFNFVDAINPQADVMIGGGVKIGHVESITIHGEYIQVRVLINHGVRIPVGSKFQILSKGLMGDKYLNVIPLTTSAEVIQSGTRVAGVEPANMDKAVQRLDKVADSVRALADRGNLEDALELCGKAIIGDKLAGELRYLEATILLELNREEEAVRSLKRTLYLDPDFVLAHFTLGNLAIRRGDAQTGRRCFENALSLLAARGDEDLLSESEGLTAGRFREIIHATLQLGASA